MMQFMPLMVIFFGFRFPAGLAIYWVTSTLVGIVQQYFINGWGSLADMIPALRRYQPAYVTAGRVIRGPSAGPSTPTQKLSLRAGTSEGDSGTSDRAADQQRGASKAPRVQQSNRRPVVNATRPTGPRKQGSRR
jgi:YidC/Oxa1 family membrane protein insertase